jgi:predicted S18 family serine protease
MPRARKLMDQVKLCKPRRRGLAGIISLALLIGVVLGVVLAAGWYSSRPPLVLGQNELRSRSISIVGVTEGASPAGELATLTVELRQGSGRVLIGIPPYENDDTQMAARNAVRAASSETGFDLSNVDVAYSIDSTAQMITGPSAGTAMAVVLVAVIENKDVLQGAITSATCDESGRLGAVGDIDIKISAAEQAGYTLFVVSNNQPGVPRTSSIQVEKAGTLAEAAGLMLR